MGLDGLRAIAAGLVLVFHLLPGHGAGFIGVDVFFVLSGFLITALLAREWSATGAIAYGRFWTRRFRRLVPAVVVASLGSAALALAVGGDALVDLGRQVFGSLSATYNWVEIARGGSYFDAANPRLLTNMWSLALEQQFYLLWPLLLAAILRMGKRAPRILAALAIAGGSATWHAHLAPGDITRAYIGTDSHLWGLMFGAALAFLVPGALGQMDRAGRPAAWLWGIAGWLGLAGILLIGLAMPDGPWLYPWGMIAASAFAVPIIRAMFADVREIGPARLLAGLLGGRVLTWLGERSYGIYLWHWPLATLLYYSQPRLSPALGALVVIPASIALAALSFSYVEQPVRTRGLRGAWVAWRDRISSSPAPAALARLIAPLLLVGAASWAIAIAPPVSSAERAVSAGQAAPAAGSQDQDDSPRPKDNPADPPTPSPTEPTVSETAEPPASEDEVEERGEEARGDESGDDPQGESGAIVGSEVTVIGDSVTAAGQAALDARLPGVYVDAEVSRSVRVAPQILKDLAERGQLRSYVVIALATNGNIRPQDSQAILDAIGPDRTLILVTGFGTARTTWIGEANAEIQRIAAEHPDRVRIADWASAIADHTDLLAGDSIHPGRQGAEIYADTIVRALEVG